MARLCPLFSGSSGNSYYIGSKDAGILIDVGRSAKQITNMLHDCDIPIDAVKGIFITHEHVDHVKGLRVFASKNHIQVFSSRGTLNALEQSGMLTSDYRADVVSAEGIECAGMMVRPFHTSHDCSEGYGYRIHTSDDRKITFSTDLGYISSDVRECLNDSDFIIIESNHDVGMLKSGRYPYPLKRRILSDIGHLSNTACSDVLPELARNGTTRFMLAHLSSENNTPELAYQTALCSLTMAGLHNDIDFKLSVAPRENIQAKTLLF